MTGLKLHLHKGREIPIVRGHPWVMSGAIARLEGDATADEADILSHDGRFVGRATVHPQSEIRARVFATEPEARLNAPGLRQALAIARDRRAQWHTLDPRAAGRIVFSESDNLPGLIVDRYADVLVTQFLTAPMEARRDLILAALQELWQPRCIWDRSDVDQRRFDGLTPRKGLAAGALPEEPVTFTEGDCTWRADIEYGHKTGFYLDQRVNRARLAAWVRQLGAPRVLNVFAYTDAFGICALAAGAAHVLAVDSSAVAAEQATAQAALNPAIDPARRQFHSGDAFETLRTLRTERKVFDLIVIDPPRLVTRKDRMPQGLRAYKDINLMAFQLVRPGGIVFTFSCSGLVDRALFGKVVEGAARDAGRAVQFLEDLGQPPDHPRKPGFAESEYLKGLVVGC